MRRPVIVGMCSVILAAACSAGADRPGPAGLPAEVAGQFAARAEGVAAALDAGACDQALAEARSLQSDLGDLRADPAVKAEALAAAGRLTAAIECAPPTTTTTVPPPPRESGRGKGKKDKGADKGGDEDGGDKHKRDQDDD